MRTRRNYGVIGTVQTLSTTSTGGVFTADDQRIAQASSVWPGLTTPSIDYLVVAGGGGGGRYGGGGGAGGLVRNLLIFHYISELTSLVRKRVEHVPFRMAR